MVCLGYGNTLIRSRSLSNGIPYRLDNQISPPYPESWSEGLYKQTFSQNNEGDAGMRNTGTKYTGRAYTYADGDSTEICGE